MLRTPEQDAAHPGATLRAYLRWGQRPQLGAMMTGGVPIDVKRQAGRLFRSYMTVRVYTQEKPSTGFLDGEKQLQIQSDHLL